MLQVHNMKVDKIRHGYANYCQMREQAVLEGVTLQEIQERRQAEEAGLEGGKKAKTARAGGLASKKGLANAKKRFAAKAKNDVDVMIKMKDEEGRIVEFETEDVTVGVVAPKKKKKTAKTVRTETSITVGSQATIEAEDTLAMIKNALKSGAGKAIEDYGDAIDNDAVPKKKTIKKAASSKKKEPKMPKLEDYHEQLQGDYEEMKEEY